MKVAVIRCEEYHQEAVDKAVEEALTGIGGMSRFVRPGNTVLLKVNALTPKLPEAAVTTHPAMIAAVAREVIKAGGVPLVGDSSGGIIAGQAPTKQTFQVAGIAEAAEKSGARLVNFDTSGVRAVQVDGPVKILHIAQPVLDADVVISMPKLKTHSAAIFTGAVKNMYGCIPGFRKAEYHRMLPKLKEFSELLVDILSVSRPSLAIMDGIVGMEGNGPSAGNPRKVGVVIAGADSVAVDAVASSIIGLNPFDVYSTRIAHRRGLGKGELKDIEVVGLPIAEAKVEDFDLPSNALLETAPGFIVKGFLGLLKARPEINRDTCRGCRFCVESCPVEAMDMPGEFPEINYTKCISCLCCQELCPQKAVEMRQSNPLGKVIAGIINSMKKRKRARYM